MLKSLLKFNFKIIDEFGITKPYECISEKDIIKWCKNYVKNSERYINIKFTKIHIEKSTIIFEFSHGHNYKDFDSISEYLLNLNFEEDFIIDESIGVLKMIIFK